MKLLAIGPGQSTIELGDQLTNLNKDIKTLGLHRVFPFLKEEFDIDIDYWTWGDPEAIEKGINYIKENPTTPIPTMIVPWWYRSVEDFSKMIGTSPITKSKDRINLYHNFLEQYKDKVHYIENAYASRYLTENNQTPLDEDGNLPLAYISNPKLRFSGQFTIFGTVPFDGKHSESNWAQENKFTTAILPIAHYLKTTEIYCLGFDNKGGRIDSHVPQSNNNPDTIANYMKKMYPWVNEWKEYHKINIYSVTPNEYTPNNLILEYKPLKELSNG